MKHGIKRAICLLLAAATMVLRTGCGAGSNGQRRTDTTNTLYVGYVSSSFPTSYMPWQSRDGIAPTISGMLYSTLFTYDEEDGSYLPSLADSWCYTDKSGVPLVTEDGAIDYDLVAETYAEEQTLPDTNLKKYMVVRIELNPVAKWSDGEPVTVEDVYFSFDLCANNQLSNHAGALTWVSDLKHKYQDGKLQSQGMFTYDNNPYGYPIAEEEKDRVMYLHVNTVMGAVASLFTTILILPRHVWATEISPEMPINSGNPSQRLTYLYENPVGCGPYTLDRANTNAAMITLKRNPDYFRKDDDGGMLYKVETIKFLLYQEMNVAIFAIKKGYLDVLDCSIPANYGQLFAQEENMQVFSVPNTFVNTLVLNLNPVEGQRNPMRDLLGDERFRRAIALAVNQQELIDNQMDGEGRTYSAGLISDTLTDLYNPESDILNYDYEERLREANEILDGYAPQKDSLGYRIYEGQRLSFEILGAPTQRGVVKAVEGIDLDVHKGECVALVGESGCGKSTLANAMLGMLTPTEGKVYFEGKDLNALPKKEFRELRRGMQMIFQDPFSSLNPRFNLLEIIGEPMVIRGGFSQEEITRRVVEMLELVGLSEGDLYRYPSEFSGGQRQRIGIARAIILNPSFLVCDEPVSALDVSVHAQILNLLDKIQRERGITYLFISHNLAVVKSICDHMAVMYLGKVMESGSTEKIFANTLHPYTQALLSAVLDVDVDNPRERIVLEGDIPSPVNPPVGCRFCSRCPRAMPQCKDTPPKLAEIEPDHFIACHLYEACRE